MEDGFNLTQLAELCCPTELILVRPGEFLFREGDEAQSLYVVKKGSLRIMSGSVVYETITAGGVVGEMALIDDGAPRSASVLAVTHTELWEIDTDTFRSMVATEPEFRTHDHAGHGAPPPYHESAVSPDGIRVGCDLT